MTARLYVATRDGTGVKIGRSSNPSARMAGIASEHGHSVFLAHQTDATPLADEAEALAHWNLRHAHMGGEWFAVDASTAFAAASHALELVAAGERAPQRINHATPFADLKDVRVQLVISPSEIEALDEWRAKHKIWSRSEAIRRLIAAGIAPDAKR